MPLHLTIVITSLLIKLHILLQLTVNSNELFLNERFYKSEGLGPIKKGSLFESGYIFILAFESSVKLKQIP